jgi:mono/diheme cytochrome c family protein
MLNAMANPRLLLAGAVAVAVFVAWLSFGPVGEWFGSAPAEADRLALGGRIYAERCASCHGVKLEGQPNWQERKPDGKLPAPPHDASGHTWHHPDQVLIAITRDGLGPYAPAGYQSDMPAFAGVLSDAEIAAVIDYVKNAWPENIRNRQAAMTRSYRPNPQ